MPNGLEALKGATGISAQPKEPLPFRIIEFLTGVPTNPDFYRNASKEETFMNTVPQAAIAALGGLAAKMSMPKKAPFVSKEAWKQTLDPKVDQALKELRALETGEGKILAADDNYFSALDRLENTAINEAGGLENLPGSYVKNRIFGEAAPNYINPGATKKYGGFVEEFDHLPKNLIKTQIEPRNYGPIAGSENFPKTKFNYNTQINAASRVLSKRPQTRREFFESAGKLSDDMKIDRLGKLETQKERLSQAKWDITSNKEGFDPVAYGKLHDQYYNTLDELDNVGMQIKGPSMLQKIRHAVDKADEVVEKVNTPLEALKQIAKPAGSTDEGRRNFFKAIGNAFGPKTGMK